MSNFAFRSGARGLSVATWNVAAINNNPFEYWITMKGHPAYNKMMVDVENFIENPGSEDVAVNEVFTDAMYDSLEQYMGSAGFKDLPKVRKFWEDDFKSRPIITGFMKDKSLGSKRLTSMPDRYTNTINVVGSSDPVCRPTVINMYEGDLSTLDLWWKQWSTYMFETPLTITGKNGQETMKVCEMLAPIKSSKYPAITPEEEAISIPLQVVAHAIFDSILVHMLNTVSGPSVWQPMKREIVQALNKQKVPKTLGILAEQYIESDVICLQEASAAMIEEARSVPILSSKFHIVASAHLDAKRDQNSVVFLSKAKFPKGAESEITDLVEKAFPEGVKVPVAQGDIMAITAVDSAGRSFVVASFHGDTNGLATIPVLRAIHKVMKETPALQGHKLVFGLDANTYETGTKDKQGVVEFGEEFVSLGYSSNWGDKPSPTEYTTYNARTYLQPQLNKALKNEEKRAKGDVNPKDFVLFEAASWEVIDNLKDNTGKGSYLEDTPFPTLEWPSDHGLLCCHLGAK
ncbi:hypothetical protein TrCOL_g13336 [Triparma columacea]|uniref:Endonuclease/exonuclease/phosphatase domain-containing protein n=1 Tax=Triparma columacea TaxID=722753 RepID=A0A9W7GF21_9STRA|nr:hypothetical protein TrCOL_g13336 [Triparma columacea]